MKLLVRYFKDNDDTQNLLGEEILVNIEEFLCYEIEENKKIFINKKFSRFTCYRWKLLAVIDVETDSFVRSVNIILAELPSKDEEYLTQTLKKNKAAGRGGINQLLYKGKIVEVEFGHYFSIYKANKKVRTNKRYTSTVQNGEMHKRRLAIVIKVQRNMVQVVPITSKEPTNINDKSCFKLESNTLRETVYFSEDISSWVICPMIQTVSASRILPVEIKARYRNKGEYPRNNSYKLKISKVDTINLEKALLHAVNLSEYYDYYLKNKELVNELEKATLKLNELREELDEAIKYKKGCLNAGFSLADLT